MSKPLFAEVEIGKDERSKQVIKAALTSGFADCLLPDAGKAGR
jgi:hypothetical protein